MTDKQPADAARGVRIDPLFNLFAEEPIPDSDMVRKVSESILDAENQFSAYDPNNRKETK